MISMMFVLNSPDCEMMLPSHAVPREPRPSPPPTVKTASPLSSVLSHFHETAPLSVSVTVEHDVLDKMYMSSPVENSVMTTPSRKVRLARSDATLAKPVMSVAILPFSSRTTLPRTRASPIFTPSFSMVVSDTVTRDSWPSLLTVRRMPSPTLTPSSASNVTLSSATLKVPTPSTSAKSKSDVAFADNSVQLGYLTPPVPRAQVHPSGRRARPSRPRQLNRSYCARTPRWSKQLGRQGGNASMQSQSSSWSYSGSERSVDAVHLTREAMHRAATMPCSALHEGKAAAAHTSSPSPGTSAWQIMEGSSPFTMRSASTVRQASEDSANSSAHHVSHSAWSSNLYTLLQLATMTEHNSSQPTTDRGKRVRKTRKRKPGI
mmetsp:Transcript_8829/g.28190  ORF Transcript_8829/g.28190 Transcript_8829/m.28190 type:complete len:376 (+) Transcript_8829:2799-3926(+)